MKQTLNVALTVDPYLPVPPLFYGGIERVVDFLVRGLVNRGHQVTLFAHPDSNTTAELVPYGTPPHKGAWPRLQELWQLGSKLWLTRHRFDIVHSFGRLAALLPILQEKKLPKIQSYQREVPWDGVKKAVWLAGKSITFTACSTSMYSGLREVNANGSWMTVFNGVDLSKFHFVPRVAQDAPLAFLGRLEPIKGAHNAIRIARLANRRLIIAGNAVNSSTEYFERAIKPALDGENVKYVGPVDDTSKNLLLGSCAALLMPIEWEEPFGIVMAEAMACGTPVIGYRRGSVPEVVKDGLTGFVCDNATQSAAAVAKLPTLQRVNVRHDCEDRFSNEVIVSEYESLYARALST